MKILVTGAAGFIGSNFIHYEVEKYKDDFFVALDSLTYAGNYNNLKKIESKENFKFVKGDITDSNFIDELFKKEKFDIVINFAAESHVVRACENPEIFIKTNILGTQILLEASKKNGNIRFHQISTDEVYGDISLDSNIKFTEESLIRPNNPYAASKASADLLTLSYYKVYNLPVTISRCTNNYGPYQHPEKLIPLVITKALKNEKITVHGTGENTRDWISVYDHINGIDMIVRNGKIGEIYNLGSGVEKQNIEIVKTILKYMNKSEELITFVKNRQSNDLRYSMDTSKIQKELNWKPIHSFEEYLKKTISWYLSNQEWLESIKE